MFRRLKAYFDFIGSMFRVNRGLLRGMWKLTRLPQPALTFFGGSKLPQDHPAAQIICDLAKKLAHNGFSIITGGGPGIMEAANLGAAEHAEDHTKGGPVTMGIGLARLAPYNKYVQDHITLPYFFTRKWLLVRYSVGFIVGPGGFGTLDELFEVITLIQTHHMPKTPVILIGKAYWKPIIDWVHDCAVKEDLLTAEEAKLLQVTDDLEEAYNLIVTTCGDQSKCGIDLKLQE